jgi:hypothetical protein
MVHLTIESTREGQTFIDHGGHIIYVMRINLVEYGWWWYYWDWVQERMFAELQPRLLRIMGEWDNGVCNGHIVSIWHMQSWYTNFCYVHGGRFVRGVGNMPAWVGNNCVTEEDG